MALIKYAIASALFLALAYAAPAAAMGSPTSCPEVNRPSAGHDACPMGAAGCCCVQAPAQDHRPLVPAQSFRILPPALAGAVPPAGWLVPDSRFGPAPQPRARAPVPLYISTTRLLI